VRLIVVGGFSVVFGGCYVQIYRCMYCVTYASTSHPQVLLPYKARCYISF